MRLIKWLIGVVIVIGILLGTAPLLAKWYVQHWLEAKGYQVEIKKLGLDFIFGELTLGGVTMTSSQGERLNLLQANFELNLWSLKDHVIDLKRVVIEHARLDLSRVNDELQVAGLPLRLDGTLFGKDWRVQAGLMQLNQIDLCRTEKQQCLRIETTTVSRVQWYYADGWVFHHDGPLRLEKAFLQDQSADAAVFYTGLLQIDNGSYQSQKAHFNKLALDNFQFVEASPSGRAGEAKYQTQLGNLLIGFANWSGGDSPKLQVGTVDITSLRQSLQKSEPQVLAVPDKLAFWLPGLSDYFSRVLVGQFADLELTVDELTIRDGAVSWADYTVSPAATANLSSMQLHMSGMSNTRPQDPTQVRVSAKIGRGGLFKIEGDYYPFAERSEFAFEGLVQDLQLANFASYTEDWFDQRIHSGIVDLGFEASAKNGVLSADTRWRLSQFRVEPQRGNSGNMSLDMSLNILADHNQSVPLQMRVAGDMSKDEVTMRSVFAGQMRKLLSNLASKQVNPAGAAHISPRANGPQKITFRPLLYAANSRLPADLDQQRITEIVQILKDKPHLSMVFCPVSTGGEWADLYNNGAKPDVTPAILPEQQKALLDLAKARGRALRSLLLDAGIEDKQIVVCGASVDLAQMGFSYISIAL